MLAGAAAPAGAYAPSDLPDLVPMLPNLPNPGQLAPVYVDTFREPGRVLYRFDGVVWDRAGAGTLDVYRAAGSGHVIQAVWSGGVPTTAPSPSAPPPAGPNWTAEDRSSTGASFYFQGDHWHFPAAALYEVLVPGGSPRISDKVGFCFFDSWGSGATSFFPPVNPSPYQSDWCQHDPSPAAFVRMGVSPGLGDYYWSQLEYQWVDVTGLPPGQYTLRAQVNPSGFVHESDPSNDRLDDVRTIPGPTADSASQQIQAGTATSIALSGTVVGPDIPARASDQGPCADPQPTTPLASCYVTASSGGPLTFRVVQGPGHGTLRVQQSGPLGASATYTPNAGYSGSDTFAYTTTDARGLVSLPATVSLSVLGGAAPSQGGGGGGGGGSGGSGGTKSARPPILATLSTRGQARVGHVVKLRVAFNRSARLRVTLQLRRGRRYRDVASRTLRGRGGTVAFRPMARGRYVLRLAYRLQGRTWFSAPLVLVLRG